jgi:hypothetical protein
MRLVWIAAAVVAFSTPAAAQQPPRPSESTDPDHCLWRWWSGALPMGGSVGAWTEACEFATGLWELDFDGALPGFWLTVDGHEQMPVIQVFAKAADADIAAILPELRRRGYIPDDEECVFKPASEETLKTIGSAPRTLAYFEIMPTGARFAALEATPADEVPEPPCGAYGWSTHGVRAFMSDVSHPDRIVYIDLGQDGTFFDPKTVTLVD